MKLKRKNIGRCTRGRSRGGPPPPLEKILLLFWPPPPPPPPPPPFFFKEKKLPLDPFLNLPLCTQPLKENNLSIKDKMGLSCFVCFVLFLIFAEQAYRLVGIVSHIGRGTAGGEFKVQYHPEHFSKKWGQNIENKSG